MDHFDNSFIAALRDFETDMQQVKILQDDKDETVFYVYNKRNLQKWLLMSLGGICWAGAVASGSFSKSMR